MFIVIFDFNYLDSSFGNLFIFYLKTNNSEINRENICVLIFISHGDSFISCIKTVEFPRLIFPQKVVFSSGVSQFLHGSYLM